VWIIGQDRDVDREGVQYVVLVYDLETAGRLRLAAAEAQP
jgi:hypothetical protein